MSRLNSAMQNEVYRCLVSWAADVKAEAMRNAPVRTGYLRSTIYAHIKEWVAEVGAEATYASYVELGTRYMSARPFLYPAIEKYLPELESLIVAAIEAAKLEAGL